MAKKKSASTTHGTKHKSSSPNPVMKASGIAAPLGVPVDGKVSLVRTIWRPASSNPQFEIVPPLGCNVTLAQMLFIDGEGAVPAEHIPELRVTLEGTTVHLDPDDFDGAVAAIGAVLDAFNQQHATSYVVDSDCSQRGHVTNGSGGCVPGSGHTLLLKNGNPAHAKLTRNFSVGPLIVSHGLVVSIDFAAA